MKYLLLLALLFTGYTANANDTWHIIWCFNKWTNDYVLLAEPSFERSACYIWDKYQVVVLKESEFDLLIEDYSLTDTLDLLTIRAIECWDYDWNCKSGDIWPFQINYLEHKAEYNYSNTLLSEWKYIEAFLYQAKWTFNETINGDFYKEFCISNNREILSKCRFKLHNWNTFKYNWVEHKKIYANAGWEVRSRIIKPYLKSLNKY